ncbi:MAG: type II toxin-antitoxin system prevent-host-death family antitoxin [Proteobacteria bacterium]|nr:type II toxin-antitoxin system prevent-host-death family antitoxin [Pseudomonadota bacterium]
MQISNIHEAKSHLSRLIELAYEGEEVIICKAGKPMVRLIRYQQEEGKRKPGAWRGKVIIADDFDDVSPEIETLFQGRDH